MPRFRSGGTASSEALNRRALMHRRALGGHELQLKIRKTHRGSTWEEFSSPAEVFLDENVPADLSSEIFHVE